MRLQKTHKMILAGLLAVALTIPAATVVKTVHASETQIPFAQSEDGTVHETSFDLARVSDEEELSSYEKDNGKQNLMEKKIFWTMHSYRMILRK